MIAKVRQLMKRSRGQCAAALVELALVMPVFFLVGFSAIELSRAINYVESVSTLSREAARMAYVNCSSESDAAMDACISQVRVDANAYAAAVRPGSEVIISVYKLNPVTNVVAQLSPAPAITATSPSGKFTTRFTTARVQSEAINNSTGQQSLCVHKQVLVISEVYYDNEIIAPLPFANAILGVLYESTIY
jgi:Flp pilus assembly protein TadG